MRNLLKETLDVLQENGVKTADISWIGTVGCSDNSQIGTWDDFVKIADIEYHNGYGGNEIALNLKIVGDNWWLERGEYDGSEWWEFKTLPLRPENADPLTNIMEE